MQDIVNTYMCLMCVSLFLPADQSLPAVKSLGAVWLCYGLPTVCSNQSKVQDLLVLSNSSSLQPFLHGVNYRVVRPVARCANFVIYTAFYLPNLYLRTYIVVCLVLTLSRAVH